MDRLKNQMNRDLTARNYFSIWRQFNKFLIKLDHIPHSWEDRVAFFCAHLIEQRNIQSQTLKSYILAIKHTLRCDKYHWKDEKVWLGPLTRSSLLKNDEVHTRFPMHFKLLEIILFEIGQTVIADSQPYLICLYHVIICISYYGLMWIGKVTDSDHIIKAKNVFIAHNKNRIRILLFSSKAHNKGSQPQEIKISASKVSGKNQKFFCPFLLMR